MSTPLRGLSGNQPHPAATIDVEPVFSAMSLLAGMLGRPVSAQALSAGLPRTGARLGPALCVRAADQAGLSARHVRRRRIRDILPVTLPCILMLKGGGACVLTRFTGDGSAEIALPESGGGYSVVALEALQNDYAGSAIFVRPKYDFDSRADEVRLADPKGWFWGTLARFWPIYGHVIVASALINTFALALPLFIMTVYDRVVPNEAVETLWVLAVGVGIVFGFEFLMRNLRSYFVDIAGRNADVLMASRLLRQVLGMRLEHRPPSTGALANNLREFESLRDFFTSGTLVALVDLPFVFLFIAVIWFIGGTLAIIPAIAVPIVVLVGALLQMPLRRVVEETHRETAQKHALLVEALDGIETIKTASGEGRVLGDWERLVGRSAESARRARALSMLSTSFAQLSVQMATIGVVIYGVYLIGDGLLSVGALVAATILTARALAPLGAVAAMLTRVQQARVALKAIDRVMRTPVERPEGRQFISRPRLAGGVAFRDVSFAYPGQRNSALSGATFDIAAGERVAIIGRVGSGKSTVARLVAGLYEPQSGAVTFDGADARQIDPADLRRNIGYVPQDGVLLFGSVRDNITLGAPGADHSDVVRAATIAGVADFVNPHPEGYDLDVGERGARLSGGQRQAVVIARALVDDPPLLMLDEPTSFMDHAAEERFKRQLETVLPGRTLLLVTHRGSLMDLVDRVIVLDAGRVVADGPRDEVLATLREGRLRTG